MCDLGPQKTFKWAAFEPNDQELRDYARSRKENKKEPAGKSEGKLKLESPAVPSRKSTRPRDILELSDSEDELPDLDVFVRPPKRLKKNVSVHNHQIFYSKSPTLTSVNLG
jgi:hypothetical protein